MTRPRVSSTLRRKTIAASPLASPSRRNAGNSRNETIARSGMMKAGKIAEMDPGDDRAGDRGDDDRREGAQRVMAYHHFQREEHAGDRRVERGRNRRRDAASQQGHHLRPRQVEPPADEGGEARAQMDDGALASDRGAGSDRRGAAEGRAETRPPIHPAGPERGGLHDVGHALRLRARHDEAVEQADQQSAGRRRGDDLPGRKIPDLRDQQVGAGAEGERLEGEIEFPEPDRAIGAGEADQRGQNEGQERLGAQPPPDTLDRALRLAVGRCRIGCSPL